MTSAIIDESALTSQERLAAQWLHSDNGVIYLSLGNSLDDTLKSWWKDVLLTADGIIEPEICIVTTDDTRSQLTIEQVNRDYVSGSQSGQYTSPRYSYEYDSDGEPYNFKRQNTGNITLAQSAYTHSSYFGGSAEAGWKNVAFHELGHALGLEHPHDYEDGDSDGNLTTNDTVMSYEQEIDTDGNPQFTALDKQAITLIHGAESGNISQNGDDSTLLINQHTLPLLNEWKSPTLTAEFVGGNIVQEPVGGKILKQLRLTRSNGYLGESAKVNLQWDFGKANWYYNDGYQDWFHDVTFDGRSFVEFPPGVSSVDIDLWVIANKKAEKDETIKVSLLPARSPDYFLQAPTEAIRLTITENEAEQSHPNDQSHPVLIDITVNEQIAAMQFDELINPGTIKASRFKVRIDGKKVKTSDAIVESHSARAILTFATAVESDSDVQISYRDPKKDQSSGVLEDLFGNDVGTFRNIAAVIV